MISLSNIAHHVPRYSQDGFIFKSCRPLFDHAWYDIYIKVKRKFWFPKTVRIGLVLHSDPFSYFVKIFDGFEECEHDAKLIFNTIAWNASLEENSRQRKMNQKSLDIINENKQLVKKFKSQK